MVIGVVISFGSLDNGLEKRKKSERPAIESSRIKYQTREKYLSSILHIVVSAVKKKRREGHQSHNQVADEQRFSYQNQNFYGIQVFLKNECTSPKLLLSVLPLDSEYFRMH